MTAVQEAGRLGGLARKRKLSKKRASEIAKKAVAAREAKRKAKAS
jgi:hypothetical protein